MVTHRYVGIVLGLLMLVWFVSGIGMLFIRWPEVSDEQRLAGLPPVRWERCCAFGDVQPVIQVMDAAVEDLAGRPVLRFDGQVLDLSSGAMIHRISTVEAAQVARAYAAAHGIAGQPAAAVLVERDQWTVTGYFNKRRPFYRFRFSGPAATDIYVSAHTGAVSQVTDRKSRVLSWLGPIPHWLYPEVLRADVKLWSQVVIWTSIVGAFLTVTGLYLAVVAWRPWRDARLTPYRGLMAWHHLTGLAAGVLTLTWVASGLVSMNPWGFLEGQSDDRPEAVTGAVAFYDVSQAILAAKAQGVAARRLTAAPLDGRLYLMADGRRFDGAGQPAPLAEAQLAEATARMGKVASRGLIRVEDAYYRGHHETVALPAWRVVMADGVRFYFDPASARLLGRVDGDGKGYRWLFEAPHRLDVVPGFDRGPLWAAAMVLLLIAAGAGVATGVWLGWRRAMADLGRLRPRKTPKLG